MMRFVDTMSFEHLIEESFWSVYLMVIEAGEN